MIGARRLLWAVVWLALVLVGIEAFFLGWPVGRSAQALWDYVRSLAAISYADVTFAAIVWAAGQLLLFAIPSRIVVRFAIGLAALACAYELASILLFDVFGGFMTYTLVRLSGDVPLIHDAVVARLSPRAIVAVAGLGILYVALVAATARLLGGRVCRVEPSVAAVALVAWIALGHNVYAATWSTRQEHRVTENPPWVLLSSVWRSASRGVVRIDGPIIENDLTDFALPSDGRNAAEPAGILNQKTRPSSTAGVGPNVVLIVLESVAARWTGINGGAYDTTPILRQKAEHAASFDNMYAHVGRSSDSLPAMLLSRYPKLNFRDLTEEYPRLTGTSIASVFQQAGHRTAFITSADLTWGGWDRFLDGRGFDEVMDFRRLSCTLLTEWGVEDRCMVDAAIEWLERDRLRPFFLMAWTGQTHIPYEPTPGVPMLTLTREPGPDDYELERYLNVLHETDRHLGRLFDAIRDAGLAENTAIVITGDHGQGFGAPHAMNYSQGYTAYQEDVHVPLLIWFPGRFHSPERSTQVGGHVDLAPTMAALAGLPAAGEWQGRSLFDPRHPPRAYFFVAEDGFMLGVREDQWKDIVDLRGGTEELYDLAHDPTEQRDVASTDPRRCARLRQRLAAWMEANRRSFSPVDITPTR